MGSWDYKNIGASAEPENKRFIEKIFNYLGYSGAPETSDGDECSFYPIPDVYRSYSGGDIDPEDEDVLYILNALFPLTKIYVHRAEGNNTSDTWENHDEIYDTEDMTWSAVDKYTDYGGWGPNGEKSRKARFVLKPPESWMIEELIEYSRDDGETELTLLLEDLLRKLNDGLIVYEDDRTDDRVVGELYDVIDEIGEKEITDEDIYEVEFQLSIRQEKYGALRSDIVKWVHSNNYDLSVSENDDPLSLLTALGLEDDDIEISETEINVYSDDKDADQLAFSILGFFKVIGPYIENGFIGYIQIGNCVSMEVIYEDGELKFNEM